MFAVIPPRRIGTANAAANNSTDGMRLTGPARLAADPITQLADPPSSLHAMAHHSLIGSGQVSTPAAQPAALFPGPPFLPALDQLNSQIASYPGVSQHGNGQVIAATATAAAAGAAAAGGAAGAYDTEGAAVSDPDNNSDILLFLERWQWLSNHWNLGLPRLGSLQSLQHRSASLTAAGIGHAFTANAPSDAQGIDWASFGTSRAQARHTRSILSVGSGHHECRARDARKLPDTENHFRFRRFNADHRAFISHFQLRSLVSATSRSDIYYAAPSKVLRTDAAGQTSTTVLDFTTTETDAPRFLVTTLDARDDVLAIGGYHGDYAVMDLGSEYGTDPTHGFVSTSAAGHTNHVHLCANRRSRFPQAVFASNDGHVRILDIHTNRFTHDITYPNALNCSATSPNGRLRVVVGDTPEVYITDAETGQPLQALKAHDASLHVHSSDGYACAWADDDIHVATAGQDSAVTIYDARNWARPLARVACEFRHARSLRFSPVGGGKRVLVAAEADDFINVIDADLFDRKQVVDCFGAIAGVSFTPDGRSLFAMNSDRTVGGLMELERIGYGAPFGLRQKDDSGDDDSGNSCDERKRNGGVGRRVCNDWAAEYDLDADPRVVLSTKARSRRGLDLGDVFV